MNRVDLYAIGSVVTYWTNGRRLPARVVEVSGRGKMLHLDLLAVSWDAEHSIVHPARPGMHMVCRDYSPEVARELPGSGVRVVVRRDWEKYPLTDAGITAGHRVIYLRLVDPQHCQKCFWGAQDWPTYGPSEAASDQDALAPILRP